VTSGARHRHRHCHRGRRLDQEPLVAESFASAGAASVGHQADRRLCARFIAGVVVFAVTLVPKLDEGRDLPDCDSFAFREADWRSSDDDRRLATAWGIAECGTFTDATRSTVVQRLGRPQFDEQTYMSYPGLDLIFKDGRVAEADAG
jgi:hypothetical protein